MLAYLRRDPLRTLRLIFLLALSLAGVGSVVQIALTGHGAISAAAVLIALVLVRVVEFRRAEPVPPLLDVLELLALAAMLYQVRNLDPVLSTCFFLQLFRASTGRLRRIVPVLVGYLTMGIGLAVLLHIPIAPGAFIAMPIQAFLVYGVRVLLTRQQAQQSRQNEMLDAVLTRLPFPVVVTDPTGTAVLLANPAALELTGPLDSLRAFDADNMRVDLRVLAAGAKDLELRLERADGSHAVVLLETVPSEHGTIFALRDITAQRRYEEQLRYAAHHDALTGLPNRALLWQRFDAIGRAPFAVLLFDLDGFKAVNDTLGHQAGDELLRGVAQRVRQVCGADATVARLGGDEFAVLLPHAGADRAAAVESAVRSCFDWTFPLPGGPIRVAGSVGYAVGGPGDSLDEVLAAADAAMYHCKRALVAQPL